MNRKTLVMCSAIVGALLVTGALIARPAHAEEETWADVSEEIIARVDDFFVEGELLDRVDAIEFAAEFGGLFDLSNAYVDFIGFLAEANRNDYVLGPDLVAIMSTLQAASQVAAVKITGVTLSHGKKCNAAHLCETVDPKDCKRITMDGPIPVLCEDGIKLP